MGQSLNQSELNFYNRKFAVGSVSDDTSVALRIRQTGGAVVTSVTTTTGTGIILIDADGTTTVVFGTDTTIGAVADRINATANWECKVLDALRADASASVLVDGAITAGFVDGVSYYDALVDTDAADKFTYRCTWDRGVGTSKPKAGHRVHLQEFEYYVELNAATVNGVRIYEWDSVGKTETQIWRATSVDHTLTTHNWASGRSFISAGENNDLIVRVIDSVIASSTSNLMNVMYVKE